MHPSATNDPRQLMVTISQATIGGVMALPNRAHAWVMPWANPRRSGGDHACIARVATGNVAPSPNPNITRTRNSDMKPPARPVRMVAVAQTSPQAKSVHRGPKRSPTHPPKTWKRMYG